MNTITIKTIEETIGKNITFVKGSRALWTDGPLVRTESDMFHVDEVVAEEVEIIESGKSLLQLGNVGDSDGCHLMEVDPTRIFKNDKGQSFYMIQESGKMDHVGLIESDRSGKYWTCTHSMPCEAQTKPPFAPDAFSYWGIPIDNKMGSVICTDVNQITTERDLSDRIRKLLK